MISLSSACLWGTIEEIENEMSAADSLVCILVSSRTIYALKAGGWENVIIIIQIIMNLSDYHSC